MYVAYVLHVMSDIDMTHTLLLQEENIYLIFDSWIRSVYYVSTTNILQLSYMAI